ncbi:RNA-binding domain-containing protein [Nitrosomonas sp.]|uniref:RNA-binding domain-containing protein n=1 Tax=Nitrosomonas sp. TaxID=42353 RepID=UPI0025CDA494|nr:RNA-binding domain-containing protein [Nitrosomonas sp.]MCC6916399.1 putative DNA binding domain-containing protein [Nitrosomonas sp.]
MTGSQLTAWLISGESATLEFKKSTAEKERACRTLCAFANGQGGRVLFGVTPSGKAVGQTVNDRTLEELAQEFRHFEPPLFPTVERVPVEAEREVLVVTVSRSGRVTHYRGVPYERVLNTTRVMPRDVQQRLLMEELHAVQRWENQPADGWDTTRLDTREMVQTLEESIRRGRSEDPGTREPMDILRGMNLLVDGGKLSRAAVVLFCRDDVPLPDFPQLLLKVARFKGTSRDEFLDNRQFQGNAFALMRKAERFLIESLPIAGRIIPGKMEREDTPLFPVEALREALANAFVHRDYAIGGGSVNVALYDDRLEIISIGDLHFGLTPEALLRQHESKPWNPLIAQAFYRRGIIETWGRGTLKIAGLMREAGLEPPLTTVHTGAVVVTFDVAAARAARGWPVAVEARIKLGPSWDPVGTQSGLSEHQVQIIEMAVTPKAISELMATVKRVNRTKFRNQVLRPLLDAGLLEMTIPDKPRSSNQQYRTTAAGLERIAKESN